ncbi:PEGA domain-containing protein [Deinococcus aquaticus]|uniref:PEGA domain-containing protein n=1 Tax=Deinococcus aquaticus TaxID=328692 RepID=A0ABY7UYK1_9DEIO|nr:PEGA domain-containing protein [Deinococcus aquaticus]WDA57651.1 PEGA domain-containing protein [Deinococcus aquaticus]
MKPIGPYVAARELPGRTGSPVRTLRATDRLTGMPVLLHVLPYPLTLPDLPDHPALLPVVDSGMDGDQAYVVTELPLQARPADDALLTARGALAALSALHERGLTHGGLNAAQLWSVDGRVLLAGAGLPWGGDPLPSDDLYALGVLLAGMGTLPAALRPLTEQPGHLSAAAALARLNSEQAARPALQQAVQPQAQVVQAQAVQAQAVQEARPAQAWPQAPTTTATTPADAAPPEPQPPLRRGRGNSRRGRPEQTDADASPPPAPVNPAPVSPAAPMPTPAAPELPVMDWSAAPALHDGSLIVLGEGGDETADDAPVEPAPVTPDPVTPDPVAPDPVTPDPGTADPGNAAPSAPDPAVRDPVAPTPVTASPVAAGAAVTDPGAPETPQERRRRQNEERRAQAILDAQAAAARKAERLRAERAQRLADGGGQDAPIQIGGGPVGAGQGPVLGGDDLPAWDGPPVDVDGEAPPRPTLRMRDVDRLPPGLRREPLLEPDPEPAPTRLPARRAPGDPIRIGWDEDESWRVVREAPAAPERTRPRLPRWTLLVVAAALLLGGVWWALGALPDRVPAQQGSPQLVTPAVESAAQTGSGTGNAAGNVAGSDSSSAGGSACCPVEFRLVGAQGRTVGLTVEAAPPGANLTPGESLGRAPGTVQFPLAGTYRLRTSVSGYAPASLSVTVPRAAPLTIDLSN